ncbi:hypothetical protein BP6252_04108 [Coleophoma cylindrospora]|uniref:Uncharacterized protein n=1 Tax=Coleophoma cylindrospora TaxID=1849047 RepID=A0A3D8S033_9HELO|nr:hypothetical protein BP6252_04108 [Coleophoma cylindrospora]
MWASGSDGQRSAAFVPLLTQWITFNSYYKVDGKPFVSTYSDSKEEATEWQTFRDSFDTCIYFVPMFDGNVGTRSTALEGTVAESMSYMIPLSLLQCKNLYETNIFRQGGENFMARMENILTLSTNDVELAQIVTWVGSLPFTPPGFLHSKTVEVHAHFGMLRVDKEIIGDTASSMRPQNGEHAVGAIFHATIVGEALTCPFSGIGTSSYWDKPDGYETASNYLYWTVVADQGFTGRLTSGSGVEDLFFTAGLSYGYMNIQGDIWFNTQAGLALKFEAPYWRENIDYTSNYLPDLDTWISAYTNQAVTGCKDTASVSGCSPPATCPSTNDMIPYFFLQRAYTNFASCLVDIQESVVLGALNTSLNIDGLVADVQTYLTPSSGLAGIDKSYLQYPLPLGVARGAAAVLTSGLATPAAVATGVTGGIFGIAGTLITDPATSSDLLSDPGTALSNRLSASLSSVVSNIGDFANNMFVTGDLSGLPSYALANDGAYSSYYNTRVAQFFAKGKFALPAKCSSFSDPIALAMKQSLISYMLASSNVYILAGAWDATESACNEIGGVQISGLASSGSLCYTLESPGGGGTTRAA